jgi:hypothetical protein
MAPPSERTTYEVGTTARTPDHFAQDRYRERSNNGARWVTRRGEKTGVDDRTAQTYYTDITPPGPPLPAGAVLDPAKRYVYDGGNGIRILEHRGAWKIDTGTMLEWGQFRVSEYEIIREIREPGYVGVQNAWVTLDETSVWHQRDLRAEVQHWTDECAELSEKLSHANVEINGLRDDLADARSENDPLQAELSSVTSERDAAIAGEAAALLQRDKARSKLAHDVLILDFVPAEDLHKAESQLASTRAGNAKLERDLTEARQDRQTQRGIGMSLRSDLESLRRENVSLLSTLNNVRDALDG